MSATRFVTEILHLWKQNNCLILNIPGPDITLLAYQCDCNAKIIYWQEFN